MAVGGVRVPAYLEIGTKRVFACALDWPGWCRSGRDEPAAMDALAAYAPRYARVVALADLDMPEFAAVDFEVVERVPGTSTTDFGAPAVAAAADARPVDPDLAWRDAALVAAAWSYLDRIAAAAPEQLRKGPRGGGRDRTKMVDHVVAAEAAYARKIGVRHRTPVSGDAVAVAALRAALLEVLAVPSDGRRPVPTGWLPRYAARRIAWHALDHAWEIEDRSGPEADRSGPEADPSGPGVIGAIGSACRGHRESRAYPVVPGDPTVPRAPPVPGMAAADVSVVEGDHRRVVVPTCANIRLPSLVDVLEPIRPLGMIEAAVRR